MNDENDELIKGMDSLLYRQRHSAAHQLQQFG